jgi:hypothetical protein
MKKAKVMLLSVVVLTVIAGALAFKVTKKFDYIYCVADLDQYPYTTCEAFMLNAKTTIDHSGIPDKSYYTPAPPGVDTDEECRTLYCPLSTFITYDGL